MDDGTMDPKKINDMIDALKAIIRRQQSSPDPRQMCFPFAEGASEQERRIA